MMVFWVMVAGLVGLALLFILPTLLRPRQSTQDINLNEVNLAVFRQQMAELDRDLAAGNLDQASHAAARQDLERELLLDIEDHPAAGAARAPQTKSCRSGSGTSSSASKAARSASAISGRRSSANLPRTRSISLVPRWAAR